MIYFIYTTTKQGFIVVHRFKNTSFEGKNLNFSRLLAGQVLSGTNFCNSKLQHANLNEVTAVNSNFTKANMSSCKMKNGKAVRSVFCGTVLDDADLEGTNFYLGDFTGANLVATVLRNCNLTHCNFANAVMSADLRGSKLYGVDLTSTVIEHCIFDANTFDGAKLTSEQKAWVDRKLESQMIESLSAKAEQDILAVLDHEKNKSSKDFSLLLN